MADKPNSYDFSKLYETRLIIMLETQPQSDEYRQVLLTAPQFAHFSMILGQLLGSFDHNSFKIPVRGELVHIPTVESEYDPEEIKRLLAKQ